MSKRSEKRARGRAVAKIVTSVEKLRGRFTCVHGVLHLSRFRRLSLHEARARACPSISVPTPSFLLAGRVSPRALPPPLAHVPARPTPGCYLPSSVMPASARGYMPCSLFASSEPSRRNLPQYRSARQGSTTTTPPRNGKTPPFLSLSLSPVFSIQGRFRRNFIISRRTDKFVFSSSFPFNRLHEVYRAELFIRH